MTQSEALMIRNKMLDPVEDSFRIFIRNNFAGVKDQGQLIRVHEDGMHASHVTYSWQGGDALERYIEAMIYYDGYKRNRPELVVSVYAFAWETLNDQEANRVRIFKGDKVDQLPLPLNPDHPEVLQEVLKKAYSRICEWNTKDLKTIIY
jgi:hypothetical protein